MTDYRATKPPTTDRDISSSYLIASAGPLVVLIVRETVHVEMIELSERSLQGFHGAFPQRDGRTWDRAALF